MKTRHRIHVGDARALSGVADASVHLVVTSPPYPMVAMWDSLFRELSPAVDRALEGERGMEAFEAMHVELDRVWAECWRVVAPGGLVCINVGDATRSVAGSFCLYPNQARVVTGLLAQGFTPLPDILWRKPNNSPNKFMGSGMLPAGAYVTYEHEYVVVARRGGKRLFNRSQAALRRESAFFWEERNRWFSDLWSELRGARQALPDREARERSAAFPFELPYRLVCMYSLYGDTVLDPFGGTGTTQVAAAAAGRNSVLVEREPSLGASAARALDMAVALGNERIDARIRDHLAFVERRVEERKPPKHHNTPHDFPVITRQERDLRLLRPRAVRELEPGRFEVDHGLESPRPQGRPPSGRQEALF